MDSQPITRVMVVRQSNEPGKKLDGKQWINPSGGQNGNNSETYIWNADAQAWELIRSTGPDTPLYAAVGALWRDTANSVLKAYDNGAWNNVTPNSTQAPTKKVINGTDITVTDYGALNANTQNDVETKTHDLDTATGAYLGGNGNGTPYINFSASENVEYVRGYGVNGYSVNVQTANGSETITSFNLGANGFSNWVHIPRPVSEIRLARSGGYDELREVEFLTHTHNI